MNEHYTIIVNNCFQCCERMARCGDMILLIRSMYTVSLYFCALDWVHLQYFISALRN